MGSTMGRSSQAITEHGVAGSDQEKPAGECKKHDIEHATLPMSDAIIVETS
jgi:hypothetical protein